MAINRRDFLRYTGAASTLLIGGSTLRTALAGAATVAGPGPYGALATTPDANGFLLPSGFSSRVLARSGSLVPGTSYVWHSAPDGGACFSRPGGGWVYVSNSEASGGAGGVGTLVFDQTGTVVDAYRILSGTSRNCAGGRTAAGKWFSCEENGSSGKVYECDPLVAGQGVQRPAMGSFNHEAAFEDPQTGHVYLTEDDVSGRFYRFVPTTRGDFSAGQLYAASVAGGVITWVPSSPSAPDRQATTTVFNGGEGLWIEGRRLYFTTKGDKRVWEVDLTTQAISVLYDGVTNVSAALNAVDNCTVHSPSGDLYVCEDGGNMEVCVLADMGNGSVEVAAFLRIVGHNASEWAGVAFSPDFTRMYVSSQRGTDGVNGITYEITGPFRTGVTPTPPPETLVAAASSWRYHDQGANLGTAWRNYHFDDTAWASGLAPLGYGDPMTTVVSYGPDATRKYTTTYFRSTFAVKHGYQSLELRLRRDDGAVVYINGNEVARSNMPSGTITSSTFASTAVSGTGETSYYSIPVSATLYSGTNVIAVELHQSDLTSSDVGFDLVLAGRGDTGLLADPPPPPPPDPTTIVIADDAHVRDGKTAAGNYGTAGTAEIQSGKTGSNRWYLLKADTAAHAAGVSRAVLRVRMTGARNTATPLVVRSVGTDWSESTVTWNTRPLPGAEVATVSVVGSAATWYELDVTSVVAAERAAGRTAVGFVLQAAGATSALVTAASGEAATVADRPHLLLTP